MSRPPSHFDREKCNRLTSEERQINQAQIEIEEFQIDKMKWDQFYNDHIKPFEKVPFNNLIE